LEAVPVTPDASARVAEGLAIRTGALIVNALNMLAEVYWDTDIPQRSHDDIVKELKVALGMSEAVVNELRPIIELEDGVAAAVASLKEESDGRS
jgi:hypothetical protein